jgi:hypothetical protein
MSSSHLTREKIDHINLDRRFSIPHFDATEAPGVFYDIIDNASAQYRREISDIYFGRVFRFEHDGLEKAYGNVMGVEASEGQIDRLFAIQREHFLVRRESGQELGAVSAMGCGFDSHPRGWPSPRTGTQDVQEPVLGLSSVRARLRSAPRRLAGASDRCAVKKERAVHPVPGLNVVRITNQ